jgi:hypothetical protein
MSRNGSGVYSLPAGNPVVTGTTISSSWANTTLSDIATALTGSVAADGQTAMTGNLQMGNNKITGLAVATSSGDALSFGQAATISALTVTGAFAANGGATLGDASGDALTINSSAVSIPNGLNFDSNTFVIDATNDRVGVGTSSPLLPLHVVTTGTSTSAFGNAISTFRSGAAGRDASIQFSDGTNTGNIGQLSGNLLLGTGGNERMRIDSSGNVGIGTSSPTNALQLGACSVLGQDINSLYIGANFKSNNQYINTNFASQMYFDQTDAKIVFRRAASGTAGNAITWSESMRIDSSGNVGIGTSSPNQRLESTGTIRVSRAGTPTTFMEFFGGDGSLDPRINVPSGFGIPFSISGTEKMRIDSSGNLLVGTTSQTQSAKLTVNGAIAGSGYQSHAGSAGAYQSNVFNFNWTGSPALWVDTTNLGNIQLSSDYRIKRNIQTMNDSGLNKIMALRPVTYQMADYGTLFKASDDIKEGFIAHEVQEVIPSGADGVKDAENQIQSLRVDAILAVAVKAIQEQQALIQSQADTITAMEARLTALENK